MRVVECVRSKICSVLEYNFLVYSMQKSRRANETMLGKMFFTRLYYIFNVEENVYKFLTIPPRFSFHSARLWVDERGWGFVSLWVIMTYTNTFNYKVEEFFFYLVEGRCRVWKWNFLCVGCCIYIKFCSSGV